MKTDPFQMLILRVIQHRRMRLEDWPAGCTWENDDKEGTERDTSHEDGNKIDYIVTFRVRVGVLDWRLYQKFFEALHR